MKNGDLLRRAAASVFKMFVTPDRNMEYQQNIPAMEVGVVVIRARSNRIEDLRPLVPRLLEVLSGVQPRTVTHVGV